MGRERGEPQPIGNIVAELMARRGLSRTRTAEECEAAWREAVGPWLADQTRLGAFRGGKLEVMAAHSALLQELGFIKAEIIAKLNAHLPGAPVVDLRFRVGKLS